MRGNMIHIAEFDSVFNCNNDFNAFLRSLMKTAVSVQ